MSRGTARSISSSGRPARVAHHLGERLALDHVVRRAGRGDDDVGVDELLGQVLEADRVAAEALGEADRAVVVAVGDEDRLDALGRQRARGQLGGLAGADDEHPAIVELAERAAGELDRDRRDRHRALRDPGLGAGPLAGDERGAKEAVEDRPGGALDQRQLVGALDLSLDLGLADDHRVEPGGDAEADARRRRRRAPSTGERRARSAGSRPRARAGRAPPPRRRRRRTRRGRARCGCRSRSPRPRGSRAARPARSAPRPRAPR